MQSYYRSFQNVRFEGNDQRPKDLAEATARSIVGVAQVRRRDVRTDDEARRPREMRRSCRLKAVGSGEGLDNPC
jgi:hypothetical protein